MGIARGIDRFGRHRDIVRVAAVAFACVTLANCANSKFGSVDPKYGVSASARVVEPGQPVPKGGGVYRVGKPYVVAGRVYTPEENVNYSQVGLASWYGDDFHGRYTANGEIFDMNAISAAHPTLPMPSYVRVTNLKNHRSIIVRVNDRGPYANNRIIDLSVRTAKLLGFYGHGLARVKVDYVGRAPIAGSDDRKLEATLRDGDQKGRDKVMVASAGDFAPTYFDSRPLARGALLRNVPSPPDRPYVVEAPTDDDVQSASTADQPLADLPRRPAPARGPSYAFAAAPVDSQPARLTSPVSAYAPASPAGYAVPAGFMSGRGLY
jgi:rare lipoprotein A